MVARAVADGWPCGHHRAKPNPMPESVRDRCTKAHEYPFLLSKSERYLRRRGHCRTGSRTAWPGNVNPMPALPGEREGENRNLRGSLHKIGARNPQQAQRLERRDAAVHSEAHFATFPPALIEPCILAGSRSKDRVLDPFMGAAPPQSWPAAWAGGYVARNSTPTTPSIAEARIRAVQPGLPLETRHEPATRPDPRQPRRMKQPRKDVREQRARRGRDRTTAHAVVAAHFRRSHDHPRLPVAVAARLEAHRSAPGAPARVRFEEAAIQLRRVFVRNVEAQHRRRRVARARRASAHGRASTTTG